MSNQCTHGQLARSCELCERDGEIATLRERLAKVEMHARCWEEKYRAEKHQREHAEGKLDEVGRQRDDGVRRSEMGVLTTDAPTPTEFALLRGKLRDALRETRAVIGGVHATLNNHHAALGVAPWADRLEHACADLTRERRAKEEAERLASELQKSSDECSEDIAKLKERVAEVVVEVEFGLGLEGEVEVEGDVGVRIQFTKEQP